MMFFDEFSDKKLIEKTLNSGFSMNGSILQKPLTEHPKSGK